MHKYYGQHGGNLPSTYFTAIEVVCVCVCVCECVRGGGCERKLEVGRGELARRCREYN